MKFNLITLGCAVLLAVGLSLSSYAGSSVDTDGDGVADGFDDCINQPNNQTDSDQDGYGNACDCDFNNDGAGGIPDFGLFGTAFGTFAGDPNYDAQIDMNSDGAIGVPDFGSFGACYGESGFGPTNRNQSTGQMAAVGDPISGLPCSGTADALSGAVPCTP